jgi:hypothetical protein
VGFITIVNFGSMSVNALYSSSPYTEQVNSFLTTNNLRFFNELARQQNKEKFLENSSQDLKNTIVSEKIDKTISNYNLQLQTNTPLAKLFDSTKLFNETYKNLRREISRDESENSWLDSDTEETDFTQSMLGKGFYIITGNQETIYTKSTSQNNFWKEKIRKTYQTGFTREPGTLLDVIA